MKYIILTTFLLGFISLNCLSQLKSNLHISLSEPNSIIDFRPYSMRTLDFKTNQHATKSLIYGKYLKVPELKINKDYDCKNNFDLTDRQYSFDNMPCLKPDINSRMPIFKPDSTIQYKLLIKRIKTDT
ncbi:hypothetical protein ACE1ET_16870 [Saccharicrinis sp. FJH62]|uniref:hypothetical protein n=1 Tax=Saccharicrinis sp. FJH62 TaxID=3344657 RepID=UPI0035D49835